MINDCFMKLHQCSVGKYWKQRRLTICLELGFTNTLLLPELVLAKAALPYGLSVGNQCSCKFMGLLPWMLYMDFTLPFRIRKLNITTTNILSITFWSNLHQCLFFLKVRIYFYNLNSYYWNTKLRSLVLVINITPFSCSVCIFVVM